MIREPLTAGLDGAPGLSRRQDVRLDAPRRLAVTTPSLKGRTAARDISNRGLCFTAEAPLPLRSVHTLRLSLGHIELTCLARIVHCRRQSGTWVVGVEFVGEDPGQRWSIDDLVNLVLSLAITFY